MNRVNRWALLGLTAAMPMIAACQKIAATPAEHVSPATVDHVDGSEISRVTLSEDAMKRLDIRTGEVSEEHSPRKETAQAVVPYSALIYDAHGNTWIYTNPQPRVFVREQIGVDFIEGDRAFLSEGPQPGTLVATMGVAELYGTEFPVGH